MSNFLSKVSKFFLDMIGYVDDPLVACASRNKGKMGSTSLRQDLVNPVPQPQAEKTNIGRMNGVYKKSYRGTWDDVAVAILKDNPSGLSFMELYEMLRRNGCVTLGVEIDEYIHVLWSNGKVRCDWQSEMVFPIV
ncbi:MAG: hypothetical protein HZA35_02280 [Parcubacteria group bacterium]|nr:hypothetical protein [Parcubacteria group bacterium]